MNDHEKNQHATAARVRDFGALHPTLFPGAQLTGQLMAAIAAAVNELNTHAAMHVASAGEARQGTTSKSSAREALREDMEGMNRTAHVMAFDIPGLDDKFRMPRGGDQDLLTAARAYVVDATPMKADFIRFGLPADFIEDLIADIEAFEHATTSQNQSLEQKTASTAAIDDTLSRCMKALKQLDAIMRNVLRDDVEMLTAWITASHVERVRRRSKAPGPPPPPATPGTGQ